MANILVIDDDEALRGLLLAMLKATGHTAIAFTNGLDGLKHFRTAPADLVITDMVMPYSGLATIRIIRKEFPDVGIIAMTGGGDFRLDYAVGTGAHATLRKPFLVEELTAAIAEAMAARTSAKPKP
jgi:DNA-binding NtrC family response regulator